MAGTTPTVEPTTVIAGDTLEFVKSFSDYPADAGWTLSYSLRGVTGSAPNFSASADGQAHSVTVPAATTLGWAPGQYQAQGYVTHTDGRRFSVFSGYITVTRNLAAEDAITDIRSHARKVVDNIESVLEGRATDDVLNSTIEGTTIQRLSVDQLLLLRDRYRAEVRREEAAAKLAMGIGSGRNIYARFSTT